MQASVAGIFAAMRLWRLWGGWHWTIADVSTNGFFQERIADSFPLLLKYYESVGCWTMNPVDYYFIAHDDFQVVEVLWISQMSQMGWKWTVRDFVVSTEILGRSLHLHVCQCMRCGALGPLGWWGLTMVDVGAMNLPLIFLGWSSV